MMAHSHLASLKQTLTEMVPGLSTFRNMSGIPALHQRWPQLLNIEISYNEQNVSMPCLFSLKH
jgi:hypothetical protein